VVIDEFLLPGEVTSRLKSHLRTNTLLDSEDVHIIVAQVDSSSSITYYLSQPALITA